MRIRIISAVVITILVRVSGVTAESPPRPTGAATLTWPELTAMPLPEPGERIAYGSDPQQFGELRVPSGDGPFPVFVVIHGGCWQSAFDYVYMTRFAAWLTGRGFATWTIEYRRLGNDNGGWPGTFVDVAKAADALREIANPSRIDLNQVYATGHSAGGQLALWLASRNKPFAADELASKDPLPIRGVLGLAAITDLGRYRIGPPKSCHASVEPLLGGTPDDVPTRYADVSPIQRLPLGVPHVFIQGTKDPIVTADSVGAYIDAAKQAGDSATLLPLESLGHFESAVPLPSTEATLVEALRLVTAGR